MYEALVVSLWNQSYDGSCHNKYATMGAHSPGRSTLFFVECENEGGYATLVAKGEGSDKVPNKLKVCGYGDDTKETCQSIQFTTGDARNDLEKARRLIQGRGAKEHPSDSTHTEEVQSDGEGVPPPPPFVATDFQQLEEYLQSVYSFSCLWSWSAQWLARNGHSAAMHPLPHKRPRKSHALGPGNDRSPSDIPKSVRVQCILVYDALPFHRTDRRCCSRSSRSQSNRRRALECYRRRQET